MKSPIKGKLLRSPGQSLDHRLLDVAFDKGIRYVLIGVLFFFIALFNWTFYFTQTALNPWLVTVIALFVLSYCAYKAKNAMREIDRIKLGRDGEKAVGQYLEHLREQGIKVIHDIPGDAFNLDHVLIARSGIYVIETKTYSKPDSGDARIIYTGSTLIHHTGFKDNKPLIQVAAAANWLRELVMDSTGRKVEIRKVVLFPGWYIEPTAESKRSDTWVLNPKALPSFISNSEDQFTDEDVRLFYFHLSRYVRVAHP